MASLKRGCPIGSDPEAKRKKTACDRKMDLILKIKSICQHACLSKTDSQRFSEDHVCISRPEMCGCGTEIKAYGIILKCLRWNEFTIQVRTEPRIYVCMGLETSVVQTSDKDDLMRVYNSNLDDYLLTTIENIESGLLKKS